MEQPVITSSILAVKYLGILLIAVVLFWRFLMPTKIAHLPLGTKIYNNEYRRYQVNAIILLIVTVLFIIYIEKPDLLDDSSIKSRKLIDDKHIIFLYLIALSFFILFISCVYELIRKIPRMIPLTIEIRDSSYQINSVIYLFLKILLWASRITAISFCFAPIFLVETTHSIKNQVTLFFIYCIGLYVFYFLVGIAVVYSNISKIEAVKRKVTKNYLYAISYLIYIGIPIFISATLKISILNKYFIKTDLLIAIGGFLSLGIFLLLAWVGYRLWRLIKSWLIELNWMEVDEEKRARAL